jgi:hypothetical protein
MQNPLPFREPGSRKDAPLGRTLAALLLAMVCFALIGAAVHQAADRLLPPLVARPLTAKIDAYRATLESIDTVIIGTNRLFFTVDPRLLDRATAEAGCPTRSLNLSMAGLNYREMRRLLELLRDEPPPGLKLVLFEPRISPSRDIDQLMNARFRATMDPSSFGLSLKEIEANPRGGVAYHQVVYLAVFAYHNLGIGAVAERVLNPSSRTGARLPEWREDRRGFRPLGLQKDGSIEPHDDRFVSAAVAGFEEEVAAFPVARERGRVHEDWPAVFRSFMAIADDIPARVVPLFPPHPGVISAALIRMIDAERPDLGPIYYDPVSHPEFYDAELWWDDGHLNAEGSRLFTEALARSICAMPGPAPQPDPARIAQRGARP